MHLYTGGLIALTSPNVLALLLIMLSDVSFAFTSMIEGSSLLTPSNESR